jgi:hypothetical protein
LKLAGHGNGERKKRKEGAGYEASSCFMALEGSEKIPVQNTSATRIFEAGKITVM